MTSSYTFVKLVIISTWYKFFCSGIECCWISYICHMHPICAGTIFQIFIRTWRSKNNILSVSISIYYFIVIKICLISATFMKISDNCIINIVTTTSIAFFSTMLITYLTTSAWTIFNRFMIAFSDAVSAESFYLCSIFLWYNINSLTVYWKPSI